MFGAGLALPADAANRFGAGANVNVARQCFTSRFEAREGFMPPSMTYDGAAVGAAVVPMTAANITNTALAHRWDTFEVKRFVTIGYQGGAVASTQRQIGRGMNGAMNAYNGAVRFHTADTPRTLPLLYPAMAQVVVT